MIRTSPAVMASILASAAAALLPLGAAAQVPDESTRMVDVMGTRTRVLIMGLDDREEGQPVLFLHGGAGSPLESWGEWLSTIARLAPVVAYDRPGMGRSPFDDQTPTPQRVVDHAHELMSVLEVDPPYILVGHSWGGPLILYYAGRYPDEVVGMVYLDPTEPDLTRNQYLMASDDDEYASRRAEFERFFARLNPPPGRKAEMQAILEFEKSALEDRGVPEDPDVPTAILLGTLVPPTQPGAPSFMDEAFMEEMGAGRVRRFAERVRERSHTTLLVATDAGHFVHRDAPELAEAAVRRVVGQVAEAAAEVVVSEEVLRSYVGEYELAPTFSIVVTTEDGALFIQPTNQGRGQVVPESETEFVLRSLGVRITFVRDGDGAVTGLVFHQGGREAPGRKVR